MPFIMPATVQAPPPWLLLIHQLPPSPAYLRVKTARQLQRVGAVAVKNSVYVLPNSDAASESFAWVLKEIVASGGDATICESSIIAGTSNEAVEALFHAARGKDYQEVANEIRAALSALGKAKRIDETRRATAESHLPRFRRRMAEIAELDFFEAPGREATLSVFATFERRLHGPGGHATKTKAATPRRVRGAVWVTRKGVHVDRIASAWLIKRFIDTDASIKFVASKGYAPAAGEIRFDMFEAEYTHEGDSCTFEVLAKRFSVSEPAITAIAEVVHDIDVRDEKFGRPEMAGIARLIAGIALTQVDDSARLALGSQLFDALYEAWRRKS